MEQYISKSALVAEIKTRIETYNKGYANGDNCRADALETFLHDIDFLEVKDANEALRTEYEKGRHDVIEKTLKWLWDLNQEHEIMSYADSHVLGSEELQQYYKNNIEL